MANEDKRGSNDRAAVGLEAGATVESTTQLLKRVQKDDDEALNRLWERYRPRMRRWATRRLSPLARGSVDTEDVVQDTLMKVTPRLKSFELRWHGSLWAFLRRALENRIRDASRAARRSPRSEPLPVDLTDPAASQLQRLVGKELIGRYRSALAKLPDADRNAVVLSVEQQLSHDDMARALNKPTADAARMAVKRALLRLAKEMARGS